MLLYLHISGYMTVLTHSWSRLTEMAWFSYTGAGYFAKVNTLNVVQISRPGWLQHKSLEDERVGDVLPLAFRGVSWCGFTWHCYSGITLFKIMTTVVSSNSAISRWSLADNKFNGLQRSSRRMFVSAPLFAPAQGLVPPVSKMG